MLAALLSLGAVMANLLKIIDTHSMYKSRRKRMPFDSVSKMGPTSWPHLSELAPWFNHKLALPGKPLIFNFFIRGVVVACEILPRCLGTISTPGKHISRKKEKK